LTIPDSERQPSIPKMPVTIVALTGEWNLSLTLAIDAGSTLSKAMAKRILDAVRMNGGMSFMTHSTPNMKSNQLRLLRPMPIPVKAATVVVQALGRPVGARFPAPYESHA